MKLSIAALPLAIAALFSSAVTAAPSETAIRARFAEVNPEAIVTSIKETPIPGMAEVVVGGQVLYVSDDARYVLSGNLIDIEARVNLTDRAQAVIRKDVLESISDDDKIVYSPKGEVKHSVTVFTDVSCGYCKALHQKIDEYLAAGIRVEYVAFPRGGTQNPAFEEMRNIWCSEDRNAAYTDAIAGTQPKKAKGTDCAPLIEGQYDLGDKMAIQGTPAVFAEDGEQLGGFLPPDQLLSRLEAKKALADAAKQPTADSGSVTVEVGG